MAALKLYASSDGLTANVYVNVLIQVMRNIGSDDLNITITDETGAFDTAATFSSVSVLELDPVWTNLS